MDKQTITKKLTSNKLFNQLISDLAKKSIKFTGTVYVKDNQLVPLFKYLPHCSQKGARYTLVYLKNKKYENLPTIRFTDFYLTQLNSYKKVKVAI